MIQCDYRAKFQLQFPVFSSAGGSSHEEVVVGVRWRRWRLKCEDMDCVCVSFQRILPKDYRARLENGKVDFLSYSYSSWSKNGNIDIPCQWLCISLQGCLHLWRCLWVWCVDTYFTAAWGFLLIPHFFSLAFLRLKILAHKLLQGHACTCLFLCTCVFVRKTPHLLGDESLVLRTQTCYIFNTFQRDIPNVY